MTEITALDAAHAEMEADAADDTARLRFYERLADGELFLMVKQEPTGDTLDPEVLELDPETGADPDIYVLVFDREERLAAAADGPAPYVALPGRVIATMLAGQNIGMAVNLGVAPSSILIPPAAMGWLAETLGNAPEEVEDRITEIAPPRGLPDALLKGLDTKLASAAGLADHALLVGTTYASGTKGFLLAFIGARKGAEGALAHAVNEAITFSGFDTGALDVAFFEGHERVAGRLAGQGLKYDMTPPEPEVPEPRKAPGSDPSKPPILKF